MISAVIGAVGNHGRVHRTDMRTRTYHVYILANAARRIYIGVTRNLENRLTQHQRGVVPGYTRTHRITRLVHYEQFTDIRDALSREKQLKQWPRWRKDLLIAASNPAWDDLSTLI